MIRGEKTRYYKPKSNRLPRYRHPIVTLTAPIPFTRLEEISEDSGWYWTLNRVVYSDEDYQVETFRKPRTNKRMVFRIPMKRF